MGRDKIEDTQIWSGLNMSDFKGFGVEPIKKSKSKPKDLISAVKRRSIPVVNDSSKQNGWQQKVNRGSYRSRFASTA